MLIPGCMSVPHEKLEQRLKDVEHKIETQRIHEFVNSEWLDSLEKRIKALEQLQKNQTARLNSQHDFIGITAWQLTETKLRLMNLEKKNGKN